MAVEIRQDGQTVTVVSRRDAVEVRSSSCTVEVTSGIITGGTPYDGSYELTPSEEAQTLPTASRMLAQDIVVNPIPSNYGLITYDGTGITVS